MCQTTEAPPIQAICLVWIGSYSDKAVEAVFSTRERADEYVGLIRNPDDDDYEEQPWVEEMALDLPRLRDDESIWVIKLDRDGNGVVEDECPRDHLEPPPWQYGSGSDGDTYWRVAAATADLAVKIAGDRRRGYLAARAAQPDCPE